MLTRFHYVTDMTYIRSFLFLFVCTLFLTHLSLAADAPTIELISFTKADAQEQVFFTLNGPHIPKVFTLKGEKPRVVFDFAGTTISTKVKQVLPVDGKLIKRIRVGLHKGEHPKTRVVLDLANSDTVDFTQSYNKETSQLIITLKSEQVAQKQDTADTTTITPTQRKATPPATIQARKTAEPASSVQKHSEQAIDQVDAEPSSPSTQQGEVAEIAPVLSSIIFDDTTDKGEMVLFQLNGFFPPAVKGVEENKPRAICDFDKTTLGHGVTSIEKTGGKFVQSIRVGKHSDPERLRVVIDLQPNQNYDLQQVFFKEDNLFVIIVNSQNLTESKQ